MIPEQDKGLHFALTAQSPYSYQAVITVSAPLVQKFYQTALKAKKNEAHTYGFSKGSTPLLYIEQNFKSNLYTHVKEFLFHYFVLSFLYKNIYTNKLVLAAEPRLTDIVLISEGDAQFYFLLDSINGELFDYEGLIFKAPQRKNYKDIDRQVISFTKQEEELAKGYDGTIAIGDWVGFDVVLVDAEKTPLFEGYAESLWLKIGDEEADKEFQDTFVGKKKGDQFYTTVSSLQEYFSDSLDTSYLFFITIQHVIPYRFFSIEQLKHHFNLKKAKDIHKKLIEVFSFRNDLSQRRETVEALFQLLLPYHTFDLPERLVLRQQERVLQEVHNNPDYLVYKAQQDFKRTVKSLAEKQLKETILIDLIMYHHAIDADVNDVIAYLSFTQRPRMKEFIYFDVPLTKKQGQEFPIAHYMVRHNCLREKTLNQVISTLTRK